MGAGETGHRCALALAMLHVIITEERYDKNFVDRWCYGFPELKAHIRQYTPEWAAPITGIPADRIREISRIYSGARSACILAGNAFDQTVNANNALRAVASLIAITGNFDRPGGNVVPVPGKAPMLKPVHIRERYTQEWIDKLVGPELAPGMQPFIEGTSSAYFRCLDSVLTEKPYPPRTIIAPGLSRPSSPAERPHIIKALEKLDFFVVIDVMETASMPWADIVIPVATMYECDHPFEFTGSWLMARNKVVEPLGDYKSDYQFWLDLGSPPDTAMNSGTAI
jgi:anaerobic selenocysteine-containing dehydrogenase